MTERSMYTFGSRRKPTLLKHQEHMVSTFSRQRVLREKSLQQTSKADIELDSRVEIEISAPAPEIYFTGGYRREPRRGRERDTRGNNYDPRSVEDNAWRIWKTRSFQKM
eukprot:TRINITY_DN8722_c0_g1_i10.p1 TRINITY_DN8722_c0_g1~~TRINITY_DN8722_c0_g1_i10.p1  ORF type:complete len:109 (-),score=19.66 TRINITY_DN8722_c0_g1_i10:381-707(-)